MKMKMKMKMKKRKRRKKVILKMGVIMRLITI
jgi:hypothetical protein